MKKRIKTIILIMVILISSVVGYKIIDKSSHAFIQSKAIDYLCEKYDASANEFEFVDYNRAHTCWEEHNIFFQKLVWINTSFECVYKNRHFVVGRNENGFYDDYQLEDVETWCVEWLQVNVDDRITGVEINSSNTLFSYQESKPQGYKYVITQNDAKDILYELPKYGGKNGCMVYYFDLLDNKSTIQDTSNNEVALKLKATFNPEEKYFAACTSSTISYKIAKSKNTNWVRYQISQSSNKGVTAKK